MSCSPGVFGARSTKKGNATMWSLVVAVALLLISVAVAYQVISQMLTRPMAQLPFKKGSAVASDQCADPQPADFSDEVVIGQDPVYLYLMPAWVSDCPRGTFSGTVHRTTYIEGRCEIVINSKTKQMVFVYLCDSAFELRPPIGQDVVIKYVRTRDGTNWIGTHQQPYALNVE